MAGTAAAVGFRCCGRGGEGRDGVERGRARERFVDWSEDGVQGGSGGWIQSDGEAAQG